MTRRWPLQDLLDAARVTSHGLALSTGMSESTIREAHARGLSDLQADRWAVLCGLHPAFVWGLDWIEAGLSENDRHYLAGGWRQVWLWREANTELDEEAA